MKKNIKKTKELKGNDFDEAKAFISMTIGQLVEGLMDYKNNIFEELMGQVENRIEKLPLKSYNKKKELDTLKNSISNTLSEMGIKIYENMCEDLDEIKKQIDEIYKSDPYGIERLEAYVKEENYNISGKEKMWSIKIGKLAERYINEMDKIVEKKIDNSKLRNILKKRNQKNRNFDFAL